MILNIDDPTFGATEISDIKAWENAVFSTGSIPAIVCTTDLIEKYLVNGGVKSRVSIIPQGHSSIPRSGGEVPAVDSEVNFVYISPAIDVFGDPHAGHKMWDATPLLRDIWPNVTSDKARLHLVGNIGKNARELTKRENVTTYGLVSIEQCASLINNFDVALYPRIHDNGWLPQKLIEYLGAGLPVLAFNLIDTRIVHELDVGIIVDSVADFVRVIDEISVNPDSLHPYKKNCQNFSVEYSWARLAMKFEENYL